MLNALWTYWFAEQTTQEFYACSLEQNGFELPVPILEQPDDSRPL